MQSDNFEELRSKVAAGSTEALEYLVEHHSEELAMVIRRRLHHKLRSQFDTIDFQQIVWQSILENLERLGECRNHDELRSYLFQIGKGRVIDAFRKFVGRKQQTVALDIQDSDDATWERTGACAKDPTPSQTVRNREECDLLVERLPERYRRSLDMIKDGKNISEVARELGVHERTIRRLFSNLAKREKS